MDRFPDVDYFDVRCEKGTIVLHPVKWHQAYRVREKLEGLGISDEDIRDAIEWARKTND